MAAKKTAKTASATKRKPDSKHTVEGRLSLQEQAIAHWKDGMRVEAIAEKLSLSRATVYAYVNQARLELLRQKKGYLNDRVLLWFDDMQETIGSGLSLLSDPDWLRTAEPDRIRAVNETVGILSDKSLALGALAAVAGGNLQPEHAALSPADV